MRTLVLTLLFSTSAVPALAQEADSGGRREQRAERSEQSDRPSRSERAESRSQAMESRREARQQRTMSVEREAAPTAAATSPVQRQGASDGQSRNRRFQGEARGGQRGSRGYVPRQREVRTIPDTTTTPAVTQQPTRDGITTQHRSSDGRRWSGNHRRWNRDGWRHDSRYDWRRWRDRHRSIFRLGLYLDPFGWNYRRWGIGSMLYPSYYSSSFWINDPWQYRLPPAYPPYRWVRYHNDALLIDTWSGEVVDVIYNFFW